MLRDDRPQIMTTWSNTAVTVISVWRTKQTFPEQREANSYSEQETCRIRGFNGHDSQSLEVSRVVKEKLHFVASIVVSFCLQFCVSAPRRPSCFRCVVLAALQRHIERNDAFHETVLSIKVLGRRYSCAFGAIPSTAGKILTAYNFSTQPHLKPLRLLEFHKNFSELFGEKLDPAAGDVTQHSDKYVVFISSVSPHHQLSCLQFS